MGLYNLLCEGCPLIQPAELRSENAKPSPYCKKKETLRITFFNIFFPKLNITAQSRDKQTTAGNLLVLLNVLSGLFVIKIVSCLAFPYVCTHKGIYFSEKLVGLMFTAIWPARHYWQQKGANSQGEKRLEIKSKHQWTVDTLANTIIQTPVFPVPSIESGSER